MRVARNTRCSFRSSPARQILIAAVAISEIESSCRKHATKQFSNSTKTAFSTFGHLTSLLLFHSEVTLSHNRRRLSARA